MAAVQLNFTLRTSSNCKTVHLIGSWDSYKSQLPLSKDSTKQGGWKGTFRFQGSTLKPGSRYWYYVRLTLFITLTQKIEVLTETKPVHHRRLPRLPRPSPRIHHRTNHRPQTQHPRHTLCKVFSTFCPSTIFAIPRSLKQQTLPPHQRTHSQRPLTIPLKNRKSTSQSSTRDPHDNSRTIQRILCRSPRQSTRQNSNRV
jgi:hypothetical protein